MFIKITSVSLLTSIILSSIAACTQPKYITVKNIRVNVADEKLPSTYVATPGDSGEGDQEKVQHPL